MSPNALLNVRLSGEAPAGGSAVTNTVDGGTTGEPTCARDTSHRAGPAARVDHVVDRSGPEWLLQVLAPANGLLRHLAGLRAGRQRAAPHLLQLNPGGHLLGKQRGLDTVEQALQPAHQLSLRDPQLRVRRRVLVVER